MEDELQRFQLLKLDYVNTPNENEKRQKRLEINSLLGHVRDKNLTEIKEIIYPVLRDNIQDKLQEKDFSGVLDAFRFIENTNQYQNEPNANLILFKDKLIRAFLFLFLESEQTKSEYYDQACQLIKEVAELNLEKSLSPEQLQNETKIYSQNIHLRKSISENSFWTEFKFNVPFPLGINENQTEFMVEGVRTKLITRKIPTSSATMKATNGVAEMAFDKYGSQTRTEVTLLVNKYFSESAKKIYFFGDTETRSQIQIGCLSFFNKIISRYRLQKNWYWIDEIDTRMVTMNSTRFLADDVEVMNVVFQSENTFRMSAKYEYNSADENKQLANLLAVDENQILWRSLLADAKNYLLVGKLRESIIALNSSFENYFYSQMKMVLSRFEDESVLDAFFEGDLSYQDFAGKELISEETFDALKTSGSFSTGVPSVYQIIKHYYRIVPEEKRVPISKRQFLKIVEQIREYRNDIVHGNLFIALVDKQVYEAIRAFEKLTDEWSLSLQKL